MNVLTQDLERAENEVAKIVSMKHSVDKVKKYEQVGPQSMCILRMFVCVWLLLGVGRRCCSAWSMC